MLELIKIKQDWHFYLLIYYQEKRTMQFTLVIGLAEQSLYLQVSVQNGN